MSVGRWLDGHVSLWLSSPAASSETAARTPVTSKNAEPQLCTLGSGPADGHPWDRWNAALIARRGTGRGVVCAAAPERSPLLRLRLCDCEWCPADSTRAPSSRHWGRAVPPAPSLPALLPLVHPAQPRGISASGGKDLNGVSVPATTCPPARKHSREGRREARTCK